MGQCNNGILCPTLTHKPAIDLMSAKIDALEAQN